MYFETGALHEGKNPFLFCEMGSIAFSKRLGLGDFRRITFKPALLLAYLLKASGLGEQATPFRPG